MCETATFVGQMIHPGFFNLKSNKNNGINIRSWRAGLIVKYTGESYSYNDK